MSDRDELGAFLLGFVVGGLAGAVTSLLLAPQSGEETRTVIKDRAIELRDRAGETVDDAYARAEAAASEARVRFEELSHVAQSRAEEWGGVAKTRLEDIQRHGQVMVEKIRKPDSAAGGEA